MRISRPVEVLGRVLGVAVTQAGARWFIATDHTAQVVNGASAPSPVEAQRAVSLIVHPSSQVTGCNR